MNTEYLQLARSLDVPWVRIGPIGRALVGSLAGGMCKRNLGPGKSILQCVYPFSFDHLLGAARISRAAQRADSWGCAGSLDLRTELPTQDTQYVCSLRRSSSWHLTNSRWLQNIVSRLLLSTRSASRKKKPRAGKRVCP